MWYKYQFEVELAHCHVHFCLLPEVLRRALYKGVASVTGSDEIMLSQFGKLKLCRKEQKGEIHINLTFLLTRSSGLSPRIVKLAETCESTGFATTNYTLTKICSFRLPKPEYKKKQIRAYMSVRGSDISNAQKITRMLDEWSASEVLTNNNKELNILSMPIAGMRRKQPLAQTVDPHVQQRAIRISEKSVTPHMLTRIYQTTKSILEPIKRDGLMGQSSLVSLCDIPAGSIESNIVEMISNPKNLYIWSTEKLTALKPYLENHTTEVNNMFMLSEIDKKTNNTIIKWPEIMIRKAVNEAISDGVEKTASASSDDVPF